MSAPITQVCPGIPDNIERMAAEILACCERDPERRRQHRIEKLNSFPAEFRDRVREVANHVISERNKRSL